MGKAISEADWLSIETEYRADNISIRKLADKYNTSEGTIRRKAKQRGWVRDGTQIKREIVKSHFAGLSGVESTHKPDAVETAIETAAHDDIEDMNLGLSNARQALKIVHKSLHEIANDVELSKLMTVDAKNLKALTETNKYNVELIRKIRGLDDLQQEKEQGDLIQDDLSILERYQQATSFQRADAGGS